MVRNQIDWEHDYLLSPVDYPINDNEAHSTYDQFIQLRDTLIFTGKYYNDKASRKLCVGDNWNGATTNTIEVWLPRVFKQTFEPNWATSPETDVTTTVLQEPVTERYVDNPDSTIPQELIAQSPLCCMIKKDWHYRLIHKEEIKLDTTTNKVCCYIDIYRKNAQWVWEIPYKWWVAVFDWEGWREDNSTHFKKAFAFSGTTSWTDPNGTCSWNVTITLTLWDLIQKMTSFGYMERDLKKWDFLVLRMKDKWANESTGEPQWNDLKLQQRSNYWSIEYMDLPYNN